jgi:hypothetical protein
MVREAAKDRMLFQRGIDEDETKANAPWLRRD